MGARRPFFLNGTQFDMATSIHEKEKTLYTRGRTEVETGLPGVEVLALELTGRSASPSTSTIPQGVDHALCARVTNVLAPYLADYSVEVSSPGFERPLRKPAHFERAVGHARVRLETAERQRLRGEVVSADERALELRTAADEPIEIPYDAIVRGNLIDEG